ncbi:MAG: hypothetical protein A2527_06385 [Candidatus Lambdaproteobacteria bacterium RIFOXYD2_FULL_50_16]|uniref:NnrS family protein n=1 Tax=Candidatus Lambdaproteobacteria bacterium RIFOXYD2_FULL_50_16 TaxID=1817772 RepID=A0A1F6GA44_9PROT|nr:MAG: hypothetical protein A2527_06385 [Candidatus Lambdaproteobacteria bacterium RIFOXYD2_FULL_50_16]
MNPITRLFSEPHRLYFSAAALSLIAAMLWWGHYLSLRFKWAFDYKTGPLPIHGFGLMYGGFSLFALGFLFTAFPRWMGSVEHLAKAYWGPFWCLAPGWILYFTQLWTGEPWGRIGAFMLFAGHLWAWAHLLRLFKLGTSEERRQPTFILIALGGGVLGSLAAFLYQLYQLPIFYRMGLGVGLYFFWPGLILSLFWRLLPFFTNSRNPGWALSSWPPALPLWALGLFLKTWAYVFEVQEYWLISDSLLLCVTLFQFYQWQVWRPKSGGWILGFLYQAILWFPLALGLHLAYAWGRFMGEVEAHLEMAGLHALTLGLMASLLFGLVPRVSYGHSGRPVQASWWLVLGFQLVQLAALSRVGLELALTQYDPALPLLWVPVAFWLLALLPWALRFLTIYFKPRADEI